MNVDAILQTIPPLAVYLIVGFVIGIESLGIPLPGEIVLVSAALVLLSWADKPPVWACALAGLALGLAVDTRQVALPLVAVLLGFLLVRRVGGLRLAAFALAVAAPVAGYLQWVHGTYGVYDFTTWSGRMLYARVAPIAECDRLGRLTAQQRTLCDRIKVA